MSWWKRRNNSIPNDVPSSVLEKPTPRSVNAKQPETSAEHSLEHQRDDQEKCALLIRGGHLAEQRGDLSEAIKFYQAAADMGSTQAAVMLALCFKEQGREAEMIRIYKKAAAKGNTDAMFNLGNHYRDSGSISDAITWYLAAGNGGDPDGFKETGKMYFAQGDIDAAIQHFELDYREGPQKEYLRILQGARSEIPHDMYLLGVLYSETGDRQRAFKWLHQAADSGNGDAMASLGAIHEQDGDETEALKWYTLSSRAGFKDAIPHVLRVLKTTDAAMSWLLEERSHNMQARQFARELMKDL